SLRVRGAPLIGITAAAGVAVLARRRARGLSGDPPADASTLARQVEGWCDHLETARPTAVNLAWALDRMRDVARSGAASAVALAEALAAEATAIHDEDEAMCRAIGEHGAPLLEGVEAVLTHCNAGALATGGIGTALAPLYVLHERGGAPAVYADETRPLLQGARLTAWELARAGLDVTVIADSMAAAVLREGRIGAVLVGADRIAANGDAANKIGTYGLAVLARHHGVPFYVFAPSSTVDLSLARGADIPIEHRSPDEIRCGFGRATAPAEAAVWNPAFDVTPAALVSAIVTERGVRRPPFEGALP
ncbi:MAG: S-methyl-5-thioribose-1-phosphate isomerase, partial [Gemmatimonadetes bacterium]